MGCVMICTSLFFTEIHNDREVDCYLTPEPSSYIGQTSKRTFCIGYYEMSYEIVAPKLKE